MRLWYYQLNGNKFGPIDEASLKALVNIGQLQMTDTVWTEGMSDWQALGSLSEFVKSPYAPPAVEIEYKTPAPAFHQMRDTHERFVTWSSWQIWLFLIITFGLFALYLIPSWSNNIERITKKAQTPFGAILAIGIFYIDIGTSNI